MVGGKAPRAVVGDAALATREIGLLHQSYGTAHVIHARGQGDRMQWKADPHGRWDEHGVPLCRYCGAEGAFRRLRTDRRGRRPRQRLYYRCTQPRHPGCQTEQSFDLDEEPRVLSWILRTNKLFHELLYARSHLETAHHGARTRYNLDPTTAKDASHRLGVALAQLRAEGAQLISWLRAFWILGWLDGKERGRITRKRFNGLQSLKKFLKKRAEQGLGLASKDVVAARRAYEATRIRRKVKADEQLE